MNYMLLIAESWDGQYEPIGDAFNMKEAYEVLVSDMQMRRCNAGNHPMCPYEYRAWSRGHDGTFTPVKVWTATEVEP